MNDPSAWVIASPNHWNHCTTVVFITASWVFFQCEITDNNRQQVFSPVLRAVQYDGAVSLSTVDVSMGALSICSMSAGTLSGVEMAAGALSAGALSTGALSR